MSHSSKSKAKGISASSFFDLKAELSKQEAEFTKAKAAGKSTAVVGGVKRPDKVRPSTNNAYSPILVLHYIPL